MEASDYTYSVITDEEQETPVLCRVCATHKIIETIRTEACDVRTTGSSWETSQSLGYHCPYCGIEYRHLPK